MEILTYLRRDGNSFVYLNTWATGYQELVFASTDSAKRWAEIRGATYSGPRSQRAEYLASIGN